MREMGGGGKKGRVVKRLEGIYIWVPGDYLVCVMCMCVCLYIYILTLFYKYLIWE